MAVTRSQILDSLVAALQPRPDVNAAWLGGSDAFGAADALSDVDLCVDVADGKSVVNATWEAIEGALLALSPMRARFVVPEPAWHGLSQRFYRLEDAPETLLVDACIAERHGRGMRFSEREQHGEPVVLFDKLGIVASTALDLAANAERIRERREVLRQREQVFGGFPEKEARRGRALDALGFYHSMLLQPLVEALRMRWCPERFSFGLRYLDRDLPGDVLARLKPLAFVGDLDDLRAKAPEARRWLAEELAAPVPPPSPGLPRSPSPSPFP